MSHAAFKVLHIFGVLLTFTALGGLMLRAMSGVEGKSKLAGATHGLALILVLFTGFALLAMPGVADGFPLWVWLKLAIWLIMGGILVAIRRAPAARQFLWFAIPLLGGVAAYLAIYKPM